MIYFIKYDNNPLFITTILLNCNVTLMTKLCEQRLLTKGHIAIHTYLTGPYILKIHQSYLHKIHLFILWYLSLFFCAKSVSSIEFLRKFCVCDEICVKILLEKELLILKH